MVFATIEALTDTQPRSFDSNHQEMIMQFKLHRSSTKTDLTK